ncbi:MAG TPA: AraC family transcriptional regulator [Kofleriaceae bacterium]|nr:AraC family transcriptional regulator [Kofleriaceae bacterium]
MAKMTTARAGGHARLSGMHDSPSGDPGTLSPDPLSDVLQDLRLTRATYCRTELRAPWGLDVPAEDGATLHVLLDGSGWLHPASGPPARLACGDVVLLPQGTGHGLVDAPGSPRRPVRDLARRSIGDATFELRGGGSGPRTLMVCCGIEFEASALHPLLRLMPEALHVPAASCRDPVLSTLLDTMAVELCERRVGAATVMARLADIVVTRIIRSWVEAQPRAATGWLAAIRDPQIGRALAAFHGSPERDWPVEALASEAALSRSQFSERFTAALGVAPARYVAQWRMHLAVRWLASGHTAIGEVASRLGYDSESSFSRAFKRITGMPPSELRDTGPSVPP